MRKEVTATILFISARKIYIKSYNNELLSSSFLLLRGASVLALALGPLAGAGAASVAFTRLAALGRAAFAF